MDSNPSISQHRVSVWEGMAIATGALLLVVAGLGGLSNKAARNATDSDRAVAIAQSIMDYRIPGKVMGTFGLNIGSVKLAVVSNAPAPGNPDSNTDPYLKTRVELLVARTPLGTRTSASTPNSGSDFDLLSLPGLSISYDIQGDFQETRSLNRRSALCGVVTTVTIRDGIATLLDGTSYPAVRYESSSILDDRYYSIILMAIGRNAQGTAEQLFNSLQCN